MSEHSPEPWEAIGGWLAAIVAVTRREGAPDLYRIIVEEGGISKPDAERIVACVNFCQGVSIRDLNGNLGAFVQAKLEFRQRLFTPAIDRAVEILKG